jgi:hypothetical protein
MEGATWMEGWLSSQDDTLGPWISKWCVLRSYALAVYKDKTKVTPTQIFFLLYIIFL